jgi:hypothetical protein
MADGVATIPSIRPNGARSGLSDQPGPGRAKLERAGVNLDHFGEEIRFENDSVLLPMALQWRASSQRAPNRRKLLERPGQFRRLI